MIIKSTVFLMLILTILDDLFQNLAIFPKDFIRLEIVVLSSITNFHKRQAIRETWGKTIQDLNERFKYNRSVYIDLRFVIGSEFCKIHPLNRIDPLSCDAIQDYYGNDKESAEKVELNNAWTKKMNTARENVKFEQRTHGDIAFVKMLDVYRNLPEKLLLSLKYLLSDRRKYFTHLLKTDDDCYINISPLIQLLKDSIHQDFAWIGNFRKNWPVNRIGKWQDNLYSADLYPEFACGSGYVLTRKVADWINKNSRFLKRYQGEDVSMGIWLEPLTVNRIQDKRFICGEEAIVGECFLAAPQLLPEMMNRTHEKVLFLENNHNCT